MRLSIAFVLLLALGAGASAAQDSLPQPDALPPPAMDDPGVDPAPPLEALEPMQDPEPMAGQPLVDPAPTMDATLPGDDALPEKVRAPSAPPPEVTIRTDSQTGDVVEEYRQNGVVYMVRVRPERGPEYMLLDTNGDGRLDRKDGEGPVRPVYWTLYEWE